MLQRRGLQFFFPLLMCSLCACEGNRETSLMSVGGDEPPCTTLDELCSSPAGNMDVQEGGREEEPEGGMIIGGTDRQPSPLESGPSVWGRITSTQYMNMVGDVLGIDASDLPIEPDTNPYLFFSIGAGQSVLTEVGAELYAEAAFSIASRYFENLDHVETALGCLPATLGDGCSDQFVRDLGLRLYRRPLEEEEAQRWLQVAEQVIASTQGTWVQGLEAVLAGMLQSTQTLYRLERGETDPDHPDRLRYTSIEMASRVAFTLLDGPPDFELLIAGIEGKLTDSAELGLQIDRLINTQKAREGVQHFFAQYLDLNRLHRIELDIERYPTFSKALIEAMETEIKLLVDDLVYRREGDIRQLLSQKKAYVNRLLAEHYGVSLDNGSPIIFEQIELPSESPRVGFLGLGAFLTMNAHPTDTSPTLRGKYIRERLLCQIVPPPPENIDLNITQEEGEVASLRERLELHRQDPACQGCHSFIDPPGFLFERFDSLGRYRDEVDGIMIDDSGDLDGVQLANSGELAEMLAQDERFSLCMVRQLFRHSLGRLEERGEEGELERIHQRFEASGFKFKALLKALILSEGFRTLSRSDEG